MADNGGQRTGVGQVSQRAEGSSARGRFSSRSPAKEDDVNGRAPSTVWRSTRKVLHL